MTPSRLRQIRATQYPCLVEPNGVPASPPIRLTYRSPFSKIPIRVRDRFLSAAVWLHRNPLPASPTVEQWKEWRDRTREYDSTADEFDLWLGGSDLPPLSPHLEERPFKISDGSACHRRVGRRRSLSQDDERTAYQLILDGNPVADVAKLYGVHGQTIRRIMARIRLSPTLRLNGNRPPQP